jgi:hypothetical protein
MIELIGDAEIRAHKILDVKGLTREDGTFNRADYARVVTSNFSHFSKYLFTNPYKDNCKMIRNDIFKEYRK